MYTNLNANNTLLSFCDRKYNCKSGIYVSISVWINFYADTHSKLMELVHRPRHPVRRPSNCFKLSHCERRNIIWNYSRGYLFTCCCFRKTTPINLSKWAFFFISRKQNNACNIDETVRWCNWLARFFEVVRCKAVLNKMNIFGHFVIRPFLLLRIICREAN